MPSNNQPSVVPDSKSPLAKRVGVEHTVGTGAGVLLVDDEASSVEEADSAVEVISVEEVVVSAVEVVSVEEGVGVGMASVDVDSAVGVTSVEEDEENENEELSVVEEEEVSTTELEEELEEITDGGSPLHLPNPF